MGWSYPDSYDSQHFSFFDLPDGRRAYTLTGVAVCTIHSTGESGRFFRHQLYVILDIPGLAKAGANSLFAIEHWAPFFCLNAISNDGPANNAAWCVDRWRATQPGDVPVTEPTGVVGYTVDLAVGDSDGYILRVGYDVDLVGRLASP